MILPAAASCSLVTTMIQMFVGGWLSSLAFIINMVAVGAIYKAIRAYKISKKQSVVDKQIYE